MNYLYEHTSQRFFTLLLGLFLFAGTALPAFAQPDPVDNLEVSTELEENVDLFWEIDEANIAMNSFFEIRRSPTSSPTDTTVLFLAAWDQRTYIDETAEIDVTYTYCVAVIDVDGDEAEVCADGGRVFNEPSDLTATTTLEAQVFLDWDDNSLIEDGYLLSRLQDGDASSDTTFEVSANVSSFSDTSGEMGVLYEYCLTGVSGTFESSPVCAFGARAELAAPANVSATDSRYNEWIRITWTDQTDLEDGYNIYREGSLIASVAADVTSYDDEDVVAGDNFNYEVRTFLAEIESPGVSDEGTAGNLQAPTDAEASVDAFDDRVEVAWAYDGSTIDRFEIFREGVQIATAVANAREFNDVDVTPGIDQEYCIQAVSEPSDALTPVESGQVCATGRRSPVVPSTGLAATQGEFEDKVELSWSSASTTVMLFKVYRGLVDEIGSDCEAADLIATTAFDQLTYSDTELLSDNVYTYCVTAVTVGQEAAGDASAVQQAVAQYLNAQQQPLTVQQLKQQRTAGIASAQALQDQAETMEAGALGILAQHGIQSAALEESDPISAEGWRSLPAPSNVAATFDENEDRVEVTWSDQSETDSGFRIFRNRPALYFDGVDDIVEVPNADDINLQPLTRQAVSLWFRADKPGGSEKQVLWEQGGVTHGKNMYLHQGVLHFRVWSSDWSDPLHISSNDFNGRVNEDTWHFAEMSLSCGDNNCTLITSLDDKGTFISIANDFLPAHTGDIGIGGVNGATEFHDGDFTGGAAFFSGNIRRVVISETSDGAIPAISYEIGDRPLTGTEPGLIGYYPLEEGVGTTAFNLRDGNTVQDATINGATWTIEETLVGEVGPARASFGDFEGIAGRAYTYNVRSIDDFSESSNGQFAISTDSLGRRSINPPSQVSASDGDGTSETEQVITWVDNSRVETGYEIWRNFGFFDEVDANTESYVVERQDFGVKNVYRIVASQGASGSVAASDTGFVDLKPPETVNASDTYTDKVVVTWVDVSEFEGNYEVSRNGITIASLDENSTSYTDDTAIANTSYVYCVILKAETFDEGDKDPVCDTGMLDPGDGTGSIILEGRVFASDGTHDDYIQINWVPNFGEPPPFDADRYNILRRDKNGELELIDDVEADLTSYNDESAAAGNAYEYCVEAEGTLGQTDLTYSSCETGWRPANGVLSGRIATPDGGGTEAVEVILTPGPNKALLFDGVGGGVLVPAVDAINDPVNKNRRTVEAWFKATNIAGTDKKQVIYEEGGASHGINMYIYNSRLYVGAWSIDWSGGLWISTGAIKENEWHHAAIIFSVGNRVRGVLDGVVFGDNSDNEAAGLPTHTDANGIGLVNTATRFHNEIFNDSSLESFEGLIDEVRVWDQGFVSAGLRKVELSGDEDNLIAYWQLNQSARLIAPDLAGSGANGILTGGAYWSDEAAPLAVNATTDVAGNYTFSGLNYGAETSFTVTPFSDNRSFTPAFKKITLATGNPVQNEVNFADLTAFTVSGRILFDHPGANACAVPDVEMYVNDVLEDVESIKGATESDGTYAISVDPSDPNLTSDLRQIIPRLGDEDDLYVFTPVDFTFFADQDSDGVDFTTTKTRTFTGYYGGGGQSCGQDIGSATLRFYTEDGCFSHEVTVGENGPETFTIELPPQEYLVEVEYDADSTPAGLDAADIITFFDDLGAVPVDLTAQDDSLDIVYHAPLAVTITGLDAASNNSCSAGITQVDDDDTSLRTLPGVPVLSFGELVDIQVNIVEDYGSGNTCALEGGSVTIFDGIGDIEGPIVFEDVEDGIVNYQITPGLPDVFAGRTVNRTDRSFQKSITTVVDVDGRDSITETEWVIVDGTRPRIGTFVTAASDPVPLAILHDPPGDNSVSYIEKGSSLCLGFDFETAFLGSIESTIETKVGVEVLTGVAFGGLVGTVQRAVGGVTVEFAVGAGGVFNGGQSVCMTTEERISTSDNPVYTGPPADVFMGVGLNFLFAEADKIEVTGSNACELNVSEVLAAGIDPNDPIETTYHYPRLFIEGALKSQLEELIVDQFGGTTQSCEDADPENLAACQKLLNGLNTWNALIEYDANLQDPGNFELTENLSFEAGATISKATTYSTSDTDGVGAQEIFNFSLEKGFDFGAAGSKTEITLVGKVEFEASQVFNREEESEFTIGYDIVDDDNGDFVSVNVGRGKVDLPFCVLGTNADPTPDPDDPFIELRSDASSGPWCQDEKETRQPDFMPGSELIFQVESGRTSNPWEPWYNTEGEPQTQPRDRAFLQIDPPIQKDVAPDEPAVFTLSLTNAGDSQETREYVLRTVNVNNPGGAVMKVNGSSIQGGHSYYIGGQQTQEVTMTVERGPNQFNYENLGVQLYPAGEYPIWEDGGAGGSGVIQLSDSVFFSVAYTAPCSDIEILRPEPNWVFNSALLDDPSTDSLLVVLNNFNIPVSETDTVSTLGFEYRLKGANTWLPGLTLTRTQLGDDEATSYTSKWLPPRDGAYDMRAFTSCLVGGTVTSDVTTGLVDTKEPLVLGTPEPTNEILSIGSDIAITFNEEIDCESISTSEDTGVIRNAELYFLNDDGTDGDRITNVEAACNGTSIVLSPDDTFDWATAENSTIEARLLHDRVDASSDPVVVTDIAGNPIAETINWSFIVQRGALAWSPADLRIGTEGTVSSTLVNGGASERGFTLNDVPDWITPSITSGTLPVGGEVDVEFTIDLSADIAGTSITAASNEGNAVLNFTCGPDWAFDPAGFRYTMSMAPALRVDTDLSLDPDDVVGAFVGSELRGLASPSVDSTAGTNAVYLTVYSNVSSGELVTFKVWDNDACNLLTVSQTTSFATDTFDDTPEITATSLDAQQITLNEGWTWFSLNRDVSAFTLNEALASVVADTDDIIRSQTAFSMYVAEDDGTTTGWIGSLSALATGESYQIKLSQPGLLIATEPNVTETTPITLAAGWNWLGYLPDEDRDVDVALGDLGGNAADGDLVKSQTSFAQYDLVSGAWIGSLTTMAPGQGYLIDTENGGTFSYGGSGAGKATVAQAMQRDVLVGSQQTVSEASVSPAPRLAVKEDARMLEALSLAKQYRHSMTLSSVVKLDGELLADTSVTVRAMVNDDLRGRAQLQYVEALNNYRVFMMLYADVPNGESFSLHIDHPASGQTFVMDGDLPFMVNTAFGTPTEPVTLSAETEAYKAMKAAAALPKSFELEQNYPNPFNPITTLHYELPEAARVRLVVYDALGRQVATLVNEQKEAGRYDVKFNASRLSSGTYFYRIEAGDFQSVKQMILLK